MSRHAVYPYVALIKGWALLRSRGWRGLLDSLPPQPVRPRPEGAVTKAIVAGCATAARWLPMRTMCLERSYGTCAALRRHGVPARLCVGVGRRPPLRFHAWVEVDGQIVNDASSLHESYIQICAF